MPPHEKRLDYLASKVIEIYELIPDIQVRGARKNKFLMHQGMSWRLIDDGVEKYNALIEILFNKEDWQKKYSVEKIEYVVNEWLIELAKSSSPDALKERILEDYSEFENYMVEQKVIIPLYGLKCDKGNEKFGDFTIKNYDETYINDILNKMNDIMSTSTSSEEDKQIYMETVKEQYYELLKVSTACLEFDIIAEPNRAREIAYSRCNGFIDLLKSMIPMIYSKDEKVSIGLVEDAPYSLRLTTVIANDMSNANFTQEKRGAFAVFHLNQENIKILNGKGFGYYVNLICDPEDKKSEIEKKLQSSIHWLSETQTQRQNANKLLSAITFLETFFSPSKDSGPSISITIAESIAFLAADNVSDRRKIKGRIRELYNLRSRVSHGNSSDLLDFDISEAINIAYWTLNYIYQNKDELKSLNDLKERIENLKLS